MNENHRKATTWFCLILSLACLHVGTRAHAQTLRLRTDKGMHEPVNAWPISLRYGIGSDFADSRSPRAYNNSFGASVGHTLSESWSVNLDLGISAVVVGGHIDKDQQETYTETLNPSTSIGLDYSHPFFLRHKYSLSFGVEPLWDEPSRREGYKGLVNLSTGVNFSLFDKVYSMGHSLGYSSLINTFAYDSEGQPNPDYFLIYSFSNSLRFFKVYKLSYNFGIKMTRYLDSFLGYSYSNTFGLSRSWSRVSVGVAYENGGFTQNGDFSLWFIDEYRKLFRLNIGYTF